MSDGQLEGFLSDISQWTEGLAGAVNPSIHSYTALLYLSGSGPCPRSVPGERRGGEVGAGARAVGSHCSQKMFLSAP